MPRTGIDPKRLFSSLPKLTISLGTPRHWRHLSVILLAALVATMSIEPHVLQTRASEIDPTDTQALTNIQSTNQSKNLGGFNFSLPALANVELPPIPVRRPGVKDPAIAAYHVAIIDDASKTVLYEKDANQKIAVASTTKVMTALVAYDLYKDRLKERVRISELARTKEGSAVGFHPGETASFEELLYGLLIVSGNDAATALAEASQPGGGEAAVAHFVDLMNQKAQSVGMTNTRFKDPAGLDDSGVSTALEMTNLLGRAIKNQTLVKMMGASYEYTSPERYRHTFKNSNRLITEDMYYSGMIGGKTGFTPETPEGGAGHCLIVAAKRDGHTVIAAIYRTYGQTADASAIEAAKALDFAFDSANFVWEKIAR